MARINNSPKVTTRETDLTVRPNQPMSSSGKSITSFSGDIFIKEESSSSNGGNVVIITTTTTTTIAPTTTTTTTVEPTTTTTTTIDYTSIVYNLVNGISDDDGLLLNFEDMSYSDLQVKCMYNDYMNNSGSVLTIVQTNTLDGYISVGDDEFTLNGNPVTNLRGVFTDTDGIMGVSGNKYIITFTNGVVTSINSFDDLGACPTTTTTTTAAPTTTTTTTLAPYSLFATSNNFTAGEQVEYMVLTNGISDGTSVYLNIDEGFDVITNSNMLTTATLTISSGQANYFHTFNSNLEYNLFFDGDRVVTASLSALDSNLANTGSPSYDINVLQTTNINVVGQVNGNNVNGLGYDYSDFVSVMCGTFNSISWDFIKTTGSQSMVVGDIVLDSQNQRLVNHVGAIYGGTGSSLVASSYYVFEKNSNGEVSSLTQGDCSTLTTTTTII